MFRVPVQVITPYLLSKFFPRDELVRTSNKQGKHLGRLWLQLEWTAVFAQYARLGIEVKNPETKYQSVGAGNHWAPRARNSFNGESISYA